MKKFILTIVLIGTSLYPLVPVYALGTIASSTKAAAKEAQQLPLVIQRGDADITARIASLTELNDRTLLMKNISDTQRQSLMNTVQQNIDGLKALKVKLDADTDFATAQADAKSIFSTFRIYALVVPQGWILASVDRITNISDQLTSIATQVQSRIASEQSAGKDVAALSAALSDMNAKIADAKTQSSTAQAGVASLAPDGGDKTIATTNHAALVAARSSIKTVTTDVQAARKDVTTIIQGLKMLDGTVQASSSVNH